MDIRNLPARLGDITRLDLLESKSIDFTRWLACYAQTKIPDSASQLFLRRWPSSVGAIAVRKSLDTLELKSAVPPASTTGGDWGAPLVGVASLMQGFVAIARSTSLLGKIPGLRSVPFQTKIPVQIQAATDSWVGEGLRPSAKWFLPAASR